MEAFPHSRQVLDQKYAQAHTLLLERQKIDQSFIMVFQDIGRCVTGAMCSVSDGPKPGTQSGSTVIQADVPAPSETAKKAEAPKAKPVAKKEEPKAKPNPAPTPEPQQAAVSAERAIESAPENATMEQLRDTMAKFTREGKSKQAFAIVQKITSNPANANQDEINQIMAEFRKI